MQSVLSTNFIFPSSHAPQGGLFAGGSGAGITITPIAFLVIANGSVRILQIEPFTSSVDRVIQTVPDVVDKIGNLITTLKPEKAEAQEENI